MKLPAITRSPEAMVLLVTILGTGMVYLDQTALSVALPAIQADLRVDLGGLQWVTDIYILTLAVLLLIGGALGDRYGRVRVFNLGMVIFVGASVLGGLAGSLAMLVAARGLQGVGGALLIPGGFAIINATVAPERRGRVLGVWGAFSPLVTLSGPLLGGWLVDEVSWRAVFFLNVPLGLLAFVASRAVPESHSDHASGPLDWPGVLTLLVGLGGLLLALIEGVHLGWGHPVILGALAAGGLGLAGFVWVEARSPAPMLPLGVFRNPVFTGINTLTLVHYFAMGSVFFFLTLNFQQVQGYSATDAGWAALPTSIMLFLMAGPVGRLSDRVDPRWLITAGVLLNCVGFALFTLPGVGGSYWTTFFPAQMVFAIGLGLMVVPLTSIAISALESKYSGVASGFNNAISRVAQMLAVAIFGAVMLTNFRGELAARTAALPLSPDQRAALRAEASNLGAAQPPADLAPAAAEAVTMAVRDSFVAAFRGVMWLSAGLALAGLALWWLIIGRPAAVRPPPPPPG